MAFLNNFKFFDETSTSLTSNECGNINGQELILEVSGTGTPNITIEGKIDIEQDNWSSLAVINLSNYDVSNTITSFGNYAIGISGINKIRAVNNTESNLATMKVFGKLVG